MLRLRSKRLCRAREQTDRPTALKNVSSRHLGSGRRAARPAHFSLNHAAPGSRSRKLSSHAKRLAVAA